MSNNVIYITKYQNVIVIYGRLTLTTNVTPWKTVIAQLPKEYVPDISDGYYIYEDSFIDNQGRIMYTKAKTKGELLYLNGVYICK